MPTFVVDEHPELATWEGFMDPELAGLFATAETGESGAWAVAPGLARAGALAGAELGRTAGRDWAMSKR